MKPGQRKALDKDDPIEGKLDQIERIKASTAPSVFRAPFRGSAVGYVTVRYRG